MLNGVQRFRAVSNQPFLDRGTVRRGVWVIFLEFAAFEREKNAVAYFSSRKRSASKAPRKKASQSARAPRMRGSEDLNGRCPREVTRRGGELFKPQTVLLRWKALRGANRFLALARHLLFFRSRTRRRPRPRIAESGVLECGSIATTLNYCRSRNRGNENTESDEAVDCCGRRAIILCEAVPYEGLDP